MAWNQVADGYLTLDPNKKHNIISSVTVVCRANGYASQSSVPWWYIKRQGVTGGETQHPYSSRIMTDATLTETFSPDIFGGLSFKWAALFIYYDAVASGVTPTASLSGYKTYSDTIATAAVNSSQNGGYMRPDVENTFTISAKYVDDVDEQFTVTRVVYYYKKSTDSEYSSLTFTGNTRNLTVTIPANTFVTGQTYNQYVVMTVDDGQVATQTLGDISTVDAVPSASPVYPIDVVVYGTANFRWRYIISTGTAQKSFEIQLSNDNGTTWTTAKTGGSETETEVTSDHSGVVLWRVRVSNQDDVLSAWSESVQFINNVPPDAPTINSVTNTGRITVSWSSDDQIAYQVIVEDNLGIRHYDSGIVYGEETNYLVNQYLRNGNYTVKVAIINSLGLMSSFGEYSFVQSNNVEGPDVVFSEAPQVGVYIAIADNPSFVKYYILRNGKLIKKTTGSFVDLFANGEIEYTVIGVTADDMAGFTSEVVSRVCDGIYLIEENGTIHDASERWNELNEVKRTDEPSYGAHDYLGASRPDHNFSKLEYARISVGFWDKDNSARNLLRKDVFYADMYGNGLWMVVSGISRTDAWIGNDTVLALDASEHSAGVTYDL